MSFVITPEPEAARAAVKKAEEFLELYQADQKEGERALFPNHTRVHSLEQRDRGGARREKLRGLKKVWDPDGCLLGSFFERQLRAKALVS